MNLGVLIRFVDAVGIGLLRAAAFTFGNSLSRANNRKSETRKAGAFGDLLIAISVATITFVALRLLIALFPVLGFNA